MLLFPCLLLSAALLILGGSLKSRDYDVKISYQYPEDTVLAASGADAVTDEAPNFPLDLNKATREELMHIPRIGEVLSGRIVQYREEIGGYTDISQLKGVKGISDITLGQISEYLYI